MQFFFNNSNEYTVSKTSDFHENRLVHIFYIFSWMSPTLLQVKYPPFQKTLN